jgi:hypothetical protein
MVALTAAVWPAGLVSLLFARRWSGAGVWEAVRQHPLGFATGFLIATSLALSAWRIEADDWRGAIFPTLYYGVRLAFALSRGFSAPRILVVETVVMLVALHALLRHATLRGPE